MNRNPVSVLSLFSLLGTYEIISENLIFIKWLLSAMSFAACHRGCAMALLILFVFSTQTINAVEEQSEYFCNFAVKFDHPPEILVDYKECNTDPQSCKWIKLYDDGTKKRAILVKLINWSESYELESNEGRVNGIKKAIEGVYGTEGDNFDSNYNIDSSIGAYGECYSPQDRCIIRIAQYVWHDWNSSEKKIVTIYAWILDTESESESSEIFHSFDFRR
jgi:hypothetical protein